MQKRKSIALLIETSNRYCRELLRGIHDYVIEKEKNWSLHLNEQARGSGPPTWWKEWQGNGIIARIDNAKIESAIRKKQLPVVSVSANGFGKDFPSVISDSRKVTKLAAEHLVERGFKNFGYCGDNRFRWATNHERNFKSHLKQFGFDCFTFNSQQFHHVDHLRENKDLVKWLRKLPKPVGIMACFDYRGQQVIDCCRQAKLSIPEEVGIIGQHNDTLLCELCDPPLSSVIPNPRQSGYKAALLLEDQMSGRRVEPKTYSTPPLGVSIRRSTNFISTDDSDLFAAMNFIQENAVKGITVSDVLRKVPMSRTLFERRFKNSFQRSPYETILAIRFRLAEKLLQSSDMRIQEIADKTGFSSAEYFSAMFKKRFGQSPRDFRDRKSSVH